MEVAFHSHRDADEQPCVVISVDGKMADEDETGKVLVALQDERIVKLLKELTK